MPHISGITCPTFPVIVSLSWHSPPPVSDVSAGPFVVNCSKSNLMSQTAGMNKEATELHFDLD